MKLNVSRLQRHYVRFSACVAVLLLAHAVSGCSMPIADMPLVGLPANTPARPEIQPAYLPVGETPPPRSQAVLTPEEQDKIEKELAAARDRQAAIKAKSSNQPAD